MPLTLLPWQTESARALLLRKDALPHALLLRGPEGIGKVDFARKFSQSLLCECPQAEGEACESCPSCHWFTAGTHPDYREIYPEALRLLAGEGAPEGSDERADEPAPDRGRKASLEIKILQVRELQGFIRLSAHHARGKVILIYPLEALNLNAANALLKNLEEPPSDTRFILVSHRPHRVPATLLSRCQQIYLPRPTPKAAEEWLRDQGIAEPSLSLAQTGNAPLSALHLSDNDYWAQRKKILTMLAQGDFNALEVAEDVRDEPVARLLGWLQRWSYDLLLNKSTGQVRYNPDYESALAKLSVELSALELARYHRTLVSAQRLVQHPLNARLFIEQLLISYVRLWRRGSRRLAHAG